ncbi:hypothetical protein BAUCODRAFT_555759 [Baudoinia panamericana UAMH 10762]|uniref:Uncharacterized protein n=1 Tax=Baudoinia panamericana (strain UAMH 10762) TaxID=717646 RepID=M2MDP8_BAUPA|nr:uncharacterized protein BAUCODRAFT_555759 [Baudoinia panamericana UAMH 10762]EMC94681.1 hypothetical protein BAUCODRAFT_555759 [Baudoinia panamericana UAMH 10762]
MKVQPCITANKPSGSSSQRLAQHGTYAEGDKPQAWTKQPAISVDQPAVTLSRPCKEQEENVQGGGASQFLYLSSRLHGPARKW